MTKAETTDLMYAAYLTVLGCTLDRIESTGRYSKLYFTVPENALNVSKDRAARLGRLSSRAESVEELASIYDLSLLKDIADQYFILKKKIARLRK